MTAYEEQMDHCLCEPSCCTDPGVTKDTATVLEAYAKAMGQDPDKVKMRFVKGVGKVYETIDSRLNKIAVKNLVAESLSIDVKELERVLKYNK